MPRPFSIEERNKIQKRLKEVALECLSTYGIKKTSVSEIVSRAGIPKGTFYLFYPTKELLFWEVISSFHEIVEKEMQVKVFEIVKQNNLNAKSFSELIIDLFKMMDKSFFPNLIKNGEIEYLLRRIPDDVVKEHLVQDEKMFSNVASILPKELVLDEQKMDAIAASFRMLFMTLMYKREIGFDKFEPALKLLVEGLCLKMFEQ